MHREYNIDRFKKQKDFLICIDSDGTAMDSMTVKHKKCFGPCFIGEWHLEPYSDTVLKIWDEINLYGSTRGTNRFNGLLSILKKVNGVYIDVPDLSVLEKWVLGTKELSERSLEIESEKVDSEILKKALNWSRNTNAAIKKLTFDDKKPFDGVIEFLREAHQYADIAVVSSAGREAVFAEWEHYGMLEFIDVLACQEEGSKKAIVAELIKKGYKKSNVLKIGDALGDLAAAEKNKIFFYPILSGCEYKNWVELKTDYLKYFIEGEYKKVQPRLIGGFTNSFYLGAVS